MPEPDRIVRLKTVLHRSGLSRSTVYRKMGEGTFPAQIKLGINGTGWKESELNRSCTLDVGFDLSRYAGNSTDSSLQAVSPQ